MDIQSFNPLTNYQIPKQKLVLTIGNFDGIHPGHQTLLKRVSQVARQQNATAGVLTFAPHPLAVLKGISPPLLITKQHKWLLMKALGIQKIWIATFTKELAAMDNESFIKQVLACTFSPLRVLVGQDFCFGYQRQGNAQNLLELGKKAGFAVEVISTVKQGQSKISSSVLRNEIVASRFQQVAKILGRPYSLVGIVQHGNKRGHSLGFPTINLKLENHLALPHGVFACQAIINKKWYDGACNHGIRPTFQQSSPLLEAHLFDFSTTCYGETVEIIPRHYLRPEKKFPSPQALIQQLSKDIQQAKLRLSSLPPLLPTPFFPTPIA